VPAPAPPFRFGICLLGSEALDTPEEFDEDEREIKTQLIKRRENLPKKIEKWFIFFWFLFFLYDKLCLYFYSGKEKKRIINAKRKM